MDGINRSWRSIARSRHGKVGMRDTSLLQRLYDQHVRGNKLTHERRAADVALGLVMSRVGNTVGELVLHSRRVDREDFGHCIW